MTDFQSKYAFAFEDDEHDTSATLESAKLNNGSLQSATSGGFNNASSLFNSQPMNDVSVQNQSSNVPSSLFADEKEFELDTYPFPSSQTFSK